jgi:hypothetical protein
MGILGNVLRVFFYLVANAKGPSPSDADHVVT